MTMHDGAGPGAGVAQVSAGPYPAERAASAQALAGPPSGQRNRRGPPG